jgi:LuxR family transcriptional regulator, maltose regulon positive regulatory protein
MPRVTPAALIWVAEQQIYIVCEQSNAHRRPRPEDEEQWRAWLAACSSFSFQGQSGRLTLRKEYRRRGKDHYWYAYHRIGGRLAKQYVGRTEDVTLERLEAAARALTASDLARIAPVPRAETFPAERGTEFQERMPWPARQQGLLLAPKLSLPQSHGSLISREHLIAQLDAGLERKLTLLSAPAGFGKTALVSQWAAHLQTRHPPLPVAWVSLDAGDNDPLRFWRYVITACQAFHADLGEVALAFLRGQSPSRPSSLEAALTALLNDLVALPHIGVLVLEEYHVISHPQIHESLTAFVDHLPPALHLVLITRQDPPLPLARLRGRSELVELHAEDLRFSLEETRAFFQRTTPFQFSSETIQRVEKRTEGWVAGLHLLAFALHKQKSALEAERFLTTLTGGYRHLLAYFITEVLDAQSEPLQLFLLQTSMLSSLNGSLCDAVTGRTDSEHLLETLEGANLFLQPLDGPGQWYRYHALFAQAMQHAARLRLGEEAVRLCSHRASAWYEQHGMLTEAVEAAFEAQAFSRAAALMEQILGLRPYHEMHEQHTFRRWLDSLPETVLEGHPRLCLTFALVVLFSPAPDRLAPASLAHIERLLQTADRVFQAEDMHGGIGEVYAFRALLAREQKDLALTARLARQALAWLPADEQQWRGTCLGFLGEEELLEGRPVAARQTFLEVQAIFAAARNPYATRIVLLALGEVCWLQGELHQAAELYRAVLATAGEDLSDQGNALLGLARLSYEWNALEQAWQQAQEALDLGTRLTDEALQVQASLVLADIEHARGETAHAQQRLHALLARMPGVSTHRPPLLYRRIQACLARLQLSMGDLAAAERWSTTSTTQRERMPRLHQEQEDLLASRLLMARGQAQEALDLLARWRAEAHEHGRTRSEVEILILMALASVAQQGQSQATFLLREALALARAEGYQRLFLDEGEEPVSLLRMLLPTIRKDPCEPYVRTLLRAFAQHHLEQGGSFASSASNSVLSIAPLSQQEQRVLRLLAAGCSNPEIAEALVVSINTVKTQVRSIYQKLNVQSRKEAREAVRSQNLF